MTSTLRRHRRETSPLLIDGYKQLQQLGLMIRSIAGEGTTIVIIPAKACVDLGVGTEDGWSYFGKKVRQSKRVFLTHSHYDHTRDVNYHCWLAHMHKRGHRWYTCPEEALPLLKQSYEAYVGLQGGWKADSVNQDHFVALKSGEEVEMTKQWRVKAFATEHEVASQGYLFTHTTQVLPALVQAQLDTGELTGEEVGSRLRSGLIQKETRVRRRYFCSGDTTFEGLLQVGSEALSAEVVVMESTFIQKSDNKRGSMHVSLEELGGQLWVDHYRQTGCGVCYGGDPPNSNLPRVFQFNHLVLMHVSARYSPEQFIRGVQRYLPLHLLVHRRVLVVMGKRVYVVPAPTTSDDDDLEE